jgi:hypothetical protein
LLARIERKTEFARVALDEMKRESGGRRPDLFTLVFSESDTVGHHYWRDHDPDSPRRDPTASAERRSAVTDVYAALDRACGRLRSAYGEDALCLVVSDHGMGGASNCVVHLNRFLAEQGFLVRRPRRAGRIDAAARMARDAAIRRLPAAWLQKLFRRARGAAGRLESAARFGGIRWAKTQAFSEEVNTQPGVWINLAGREESGCVSPDEYPALRARIIECLLAWRLPSGEPVVASARPREAVYSGPFVERAPDIVVELGTDRGYGLSLVPTPWHEERGRRRESRRDPGASQALRWLSGADLAGGRGRGMNGTHRKDGIFIATGGGGGGGENGGGGGAGNEGGGRGENEGGDLGKDGAGAARALAPDSLSGVAPTLARAIGLPWSPGNGEGASGDLAYSQEESEMVAARLRALGYLD